MKHLAPLLVSALFAASALAQNVAVQTSITMEQLMQELRMQGGNWTFKFDEPVYAKIVCEVSSFPDGKKTEKTEFVSDRPNKEISLFFLTSALFVGDYPKPNEVYEKTMKIKLSDCAATDGTRIIPYSDKFSMAPWRSQKGVRGEYQPCIAAQPELNKEYILNYSFMEGDPYEVRATICFLASLEDAASVKRYERGNSRNFKATND